MMTPPGTPQPGTPQPGTPQPGTPHQGTPPQQPGARPAMAPHVPPTPPRPFYESLNRLDHQPTTAEVTALKEFHEMQQKCALVDLLSHRFATNQDNQAVAHTASTNAMATLAAALVAAPNSDAAHVHQGNQQPGTPHQGTPQLPMQAPLRPPQAPRPFYEVLNNLDRPPTAEEIRALKEASETELKSALLDTLSHRLATSDNNAMVARIDAINHATAASRDARTATTNALAAFLAAAFAAPPNSDATSSAPEVVPPVVPPNQGRGPEPASFVGTAKPVVGAKRPYQYNDGKGAGTGFGGSPQPHQQNGGQAHQSSGSVNPTFGGGSPFVAPPLGAAPLAAEGLTEQNHGRGVTRRLPPGKGRIPKEAIKLSGSNNNNEGRQPFSFSSPGVVEAPAPGAATASAASGFGSTEKRSSTGGDVSDETKVHLPSVKEEESFPSQSEPVFGFGGNNNLDRNQFSSTSPGVGEAPAPGAAAASAAMGLGSTGKDSSTSRSLSDETKVHKRRRTDG